MTQQNDKERKMAINPAKPVFYAISQKHADDFKELYGYDNVIVVEEMPTMFDTPESKKQDAIFKSCKKKY